MKTNIHPRRLARQMARAQLDKAKVTGYNKEHHPKAGKIPSVFARNWKKIVADTIKKGDKK